MFTQVAICNLALGNIGAKANIASLTENSKEAFECNRVYDECLEALLRAHHWQFAKATAQLNDIGTPPPQWAYRYAYPTECVRIRRVTDGTRDRDGSDPGVEFEVISGLTVSTRSVVTDLNPAYAEYTRRMTDPVAYPADFASALSWLIGAHIAWPLSADASVQAAAQQNYVFALNQAAAADANEQQGRRHRKPDWIRAR